MTDDPNDLRREISEGLQRAGLEATNVSLALRRSKDYVGDFLRGRKVTLGHKEIGQIRAMINGAVSEQPSGASSSRPRPHGTKCIHIELGAFREAVFATLRTSGVDAVLARSRIDDLLLDLQAISEAQSPADSTDTLRIELGSSSRAAADP